ncbi:MAG: polysaccharide biosynthesis protein [Clostridia bacterium]|nr:polysaccharide biosynthesis protein [Clostridia bacterium]
MSDTLNTEKRSSKKLFFSGVIILTVANILVKSVGLISKIALNRVVGSVGAGYYSSAYEIYAFLYVISTAGLPIAISIMVSKSRAAGRLSETEKIYNTAFKFFATMGLVLTGLMIIFSRQLASLMGAPETYVCIRAVAPTLLFICISSCIRGYFQGYQLMGPTAISQIIEAVFKVVIGIGGAIYAKKMGYTDNIVAAYTVLGVTVGVFIGMVYLCVKRLVFKKEQFYDKISEESKSTRALVKEMLYIAIPITVSSSVLSLTTIFDTFTIQHRLLSFGMDKATIRVYYGDYTSIVISMFNLPTILLYPIANAIVPLVAASGEENNLSLQNKIREMGLRLMGIIAIPSAIGLSVFSFPILDLLMFRQDSAERASAWLSVSALSVIFLGLISVSNAFLNSAGKHRMPIISMLCGAIVKLMVNYLLIGKIGIVGASVGTVCCYITAAILNLYFVTRYIGKLPKPSGVLVMPFICSVICIGSAVIAYTVLSLCAPNKICTLLAIGTAVIVYVITVVASGTVTNEELKLLPMGNKIVKVINRLNFVDFLVKISKKTTK